MLLCENWRNKIYLLFSVQMYDWTIQYKAMPMRSRFQTIERYCTVLNFWNVILLHYTICTANTKARFDVLTTIYTALYIIL